MVYIVNTVSSGKRYKSDIVLDENRQTRRIEL